MKNIVVGVSQADSSKIAAREAFDLAAATGATVHVVTAVDVDDLEVIAVGSDRFTVSDAEVARGHVDGFVHSLNPTASWKVVAMEGKPAKVLVEVAQRVGADLIVVGNVRMQGMGRVLGSVGSDVVHHAPCNVLIVKTV